VSETTLDVTTPSYSVARQPGSDADRGFGRVLRHMLAALRRNVWLIAGILALAAVAAVIATMLQTPRYTATTTVEINDQPEQMLDAEVQGDANSSGSDAELFLNTQIEILRSRALAERVVARLDLASSERFFEAMETPDLVELPESHRYAAVLAMVQKHFGVTLPERSRIAKLHFTSSDPGLSAHVANAFANEFIQTNLQRRFDSSAPARGFVANQLEEARARLDSSERELNAYARESGLIRTRDPRGEGAAGGGVAASGLLQLSQAAGEARARRIEAEERWNAENAQPLFSSQTVLSSPTVQALMTRRAELQAELQVARRRYLEEHPTIDRLETELAVIRDNLTRSANEMRQSLQSDYRAALAAEERLQSQVTTLQGDALAEQDRSVRYNTLAREADTNRSLYEGLLARYRALNAAAGIAPSNIAIVDQAYPPTAPSSPNLPRNVGLALLMGMALAGGIVFLRDQMDDRLHIPEDVEAKTGLPLIGVIPYVDESEPAALLDDPKSPLAESYNSLRTALLHSTREGLPHLLLVTSAQAFEGKTTTSYAIARSFARVGKRVLLIDADLRRPAVHDIARVSNQTGLSTVLVGEATLPDAVVPTRLDGLTLLTSGPLPPSPTELLSSPRMVALLEQAKAGYDLVVLDSSPMLGLADSTQLAALVDGVTVVVEADRSRAGQLKGALRRLRAANPALVGAVLTKYDPTRSGNSYASSYGDNYRSDRDNRFAG
jgi:capsular exopolysaccharide synthesis family protein